MLQAGMNGHLAKPFTQQKLLEAIAGLTASTVRPDEAGRIPNNLTISDGLLNFGPGPTIVAGPLILNHATFDRTAAFLAPETLASHLSTLVERSESLLVRLSTVSAIPADAQALGAALHILAGGAGMFGFEHLASVAGHFEHVSKFDTATMLRLVPGLIVAIKTALQEMCRREPMLATSIGSSNGDIAHFNSASP